MCCIENIDSVCDSTDTFLLPVGVNFLNLAHKFATGFNQSSVPSYCKNLLVLQAEPKTAYYSITLQK